MNYSIHWGIRLNIWTEDGRFQSSLPMAKLLKDVWGVARCSFQSTTVDPSIFIDMYLR